MSDFRGSLSVGLSVVGGGKGVTWFQPTFGLWEPNIPFEFRLIPAALGRDCINRSIENPGIAKIGLTPPPYPNPGTLVDLTTKARKCDSRHFDVKSA